MEDPEKVRAQKRRWYQKYKEKIKAQSKARYYRIKDSPEFKSRMRDNLRNWRANNRERYNAGQSKRQRQDRKKRPEHCRHKDRLARAREWGAMGNCTLEQWLARVEFYGWCCAYCRKPLTMKTITQDHRIPLARGG